MSRRAILSLLVLFGTLYFVQGIVEPTAGLPAQPTQSRLEDWALAPRDVGIFLFLIGIPWSLKPLFGLISDFLPLRGQRRRPYLVLSTAATTVGFFAIALLWITPGQVSLGAWLLFGICTGLAVTDVVIDALAVEIGQPQGLTGQMQSVQWGALSVATILGSSLGGLVAQHKLLGSAFIGCGLLAAISLIVVLLLVREPPQLAADPADHLRTAWRQLTSGRRMAILLAVGAFLFLWNFNPFSHNVLQHYATRVLLLDQQWFGYLGSIQAAAGLVACAAYFFLCRRISMRWLVHGAIGAGVLSTLCYLPMQDRGSAVMASIVFGLTYQLATLIQLDLAARVCPTQAAGTTFALLMAISNTGVTAANGISGAWYDDLTVSLGSRHAAFDALVWIGAAFTAGCWLLLPLMRWAGVGAEGDRRQGTQTTNDQ